ncbi:hypothetical protein [Streptomyces achromogenes]|uniref:hypothetical protein n=1 Tax=Streptomyces achromogenes TaxID=67255 RepID=UPI0036C9BF51
MIGTSLAFIVAVGGRGGPPTGMTTALGVACAMSVHAVATAFPGDCEPAGTGPTPPQVSRPRI